jgi:hypothetical protein
VLAIRSIGNIAGNIVDLCDKTSIKNISAWGNRITGDIYDFVTGQIEHGRETVSAESAISIDQAFSYLKFRGNTYSLGGNVFVTWESANKIILYVGNSIAQANKVVALGASASEIAEWQAAGKTVIVVS